MSNTDRPLTKYFRKYLALTIMIMAAASMGMTETEDLGVLGPDITVSDLPDTAMWGSSDGKVAYSVGTESCNIGDEPADWISSTSAHPVIAQNLYLYNDGRLQQVGMSWLKHGFFALTSNGCGTCQDPHAGGTQLGVWCSDIYSAGLNGSQSSLGPRFEVNATTGEFVYPPTSPDPSDSTLSGRLVVDDKDVDPVFNPGARYFVEGQYIAADDAASGNSVNNISYREVNIAANLQMSFASATVAQVPAISKWADLDPEVQLSQVAVPGDGTFFVASKAVDLGDGTWRYEYGVFNLNSHRSAGSFTIPFDPGTAISAIAFHDVNYHSGEPYNGDSWPNSVGASSITYATIDSTVNINANAIRWSTMYNFRFVADTAPVNSSVTIGLFRPGSPSAVDVNAVTPGGGGIFSDGFESGNTTPWGNN